MSKEVVYSHVYHRYLTQPFQNYSFIPRSALLQSHSLFQSDISTKRDQVLPFQFPVYSRFIYTIQ